LRYIFDIIRQILGNNFIPITQKIGIRENINSPICEDWDKIRENINSPICEDRDKTNIEYLSSNLRRLGENFFYQ